MLIIHMLVAMHIYIDCASGGTSHAGLNSYNIVNWDHHDQYGRIHNLVRPAVSADVPAGPMLPAMFGELCGILRL